MGTKKNDQSTMKRKSNAKNASSWREEYYHYGMGKMMPVSDDYLEKFGLELVQWAKNQKNEKKPLTCLEDFYEYKDIDVKTVFRWRQRNKRLDQCVDHAKTILGNLRENGVNRKEFAPTLIEKSMYLYKKRHDEIDKRWVELRKKEREDDLTVTHVYIPKLIPDGAQEPFNSKNYELLNSFESKK